MRRLAWLAGAWICAALPILGLADPAICGSVGDPDSDQVIIWILAISLIVYGTGLTRALIRSPARWPIAKWRVGCFLAALAVTAFALLSPLDGLADRFLAGHMGQHLLLILGVAPLIAISDAHLTLLWMFPLAMRRRLGLAIGRIPGIKRAARTPAAAWLTCGLFAVTLALWHVPAAYDWALSHPGGHAVEHLTLIATAVAFWRMVITGGRHRLSPGMAVMMVSLIGIQGALMGAIISFAPHPLYAAYAGNGLDDQALAGVMMCIPASLIYLASTIWALARMLRTKPPRRQAAMAAASFVNDADRHPSSARVLSRLAAGSDSWPLPENVAGPTPRSGLER